MREMGKAMMGTGEADGEKRALRAAEAAISNPLIDDVSMKGARGLLISITGGNDLTLYEVDEAATRIREEVDQEANIIVGATFDESLDGTIRVSVVATGIDHIATAARPTATESRLAELTSRLKVESQRTAERIERIEVTTRASAAMVQKPAQTTVEQAATAAVAAAVLPPSALEDVTIRPIPPKPSLFMEPQAAQPAQPETPAVFIPPEPERTDVRMPRMPRIDELPIPAQNVIRAQRGELAEDLPEKRHMSLLQRLAAVGLGRREGDEKTPPVPVRPVPQAVPQPPRPQVRPQETHGNPVSDYAKRPAPQGLDIHGRQAPVAKSVDDDQLDIPAFLRRQAN
jgi:cell division protein FtsZ